MKTEEIKQFETGLFLTPAKESETAIRSAIDVSEFYTEWNKEFGFFFFPEEIEYYDELEAQIDNLLGVLNVDYRIEGVF
ncbi:MAG: hypothetical protein PHC31_01100 [Clostridia bacterium]|jgi:hypothetical protein|nr:hypothetical protein [Clostridia bacterium]MDD3970491.1 hypothetical protein [Clostridia bacterium]MDY0215035.1 hypothetical protein [Bacilli bacterium]